MLRYLVNADEKAELANKSAIIGFSTPRVCNVFKSYVGSTQMERPIREYVIITFC